MIRLACTNCKTVLLIDDAFAGGVCRCQHCGTIQTVPVPAKQAPGSTVSGRAVGGVKVASGSDRGNMPLSGTGLEELAGVIHSSGISGSGLTSRRLTRPEIVTPAAIAKRRTTWWMVLAIVAALLIAAAAFFGAQLVRPAAQPAITTTAPPGVVTDLSGQPPPPHPSGPNFCGAPLTGNSVVYLIDRGSGTKEIFPALQDAVLHSVQSLGPNRQFQILFWANGSDLAGYPLGSTTYATPENIDAARRALDSVAVFGASEVNSVFPLALASRPDRIVLVTPKGWSLDTQWADQLLKLRGSNPVAIDTFSLGGGSPGEGLPRLAQQTNGTFTAISDSQLRSAANE